MKENFPEVNEENLLLKGTQYTLKLFDMRQWTLIETF